jgi:hypothetical protein
MAYRMTAARKAALRKAQAASARKRRGRGRGKLAAANRRATRNKRIAVATGGLALAAMAAGYGSGYMKATSTKRHMQRSQRMNTRKQIAKVKVSNAQYRVRIKVNRKFASYEARRRRAGI